MVTKVMAGLLGTGLLIAFIAPVALKLRDYALSAVVLVGLLLMLVDLWQSLRGKQE